MHFDPMFTELPPFLDSLKDIRTILDIGCGYGVQTVWLLERFPEAKVVGIDPDTDRVRVAARVAGSRATITPGSAPDIPAASQPADLVIMIDIVHYLNDEALRLTFKNLYDRLKGGGQLIIRASIPPTRKIPWVWWLENFKLRLNQTPSYYRSAQTLQTMLVETDFMVDQTRPSGTEGELIWFIVTKKMPDEKKYIR
jgi:trans-aconitate methyltransferase